jgi:SH3-like domain-containing protein
MRHAVVIMLSTLALASATPSAGQPAGQRCNITAYQAGIGNSGPLNVRAGPSASARLLRALAGHGSPVATISGQSGAWFRVSRIVDAESDNEDVLFRGDGWVHVSNLGTSVGSDPRLYARPSRRSRTLARLVPDVSNVTLIGCAGDWAQVRFRRQTGWLSPGGQCSNPLTTCS